MPTDSGEPFDSMARLRSPMDGMATQANCAEQHGPFSRERCRQAPQNPSSTIQVELQERFDLQVSIRKTQSCPGRTWNQQPSQVRSAWKKNAERKTPLDSGCTL